jgi:GT2 family glycosyltransferase
MIRTDPEPAVADPEVRAPTVLAVLVVRDGMRWLRDCLQGLSSQTYPRVGIVAVDNGSTDGSMELLHQALGQGRVLELGEHRGIGGSVAAALAEIPAAQEADYLLVVHDDTALEPDTVERLVETVAGIEGTGIAGPKVVDWDDPRILREVGRSTDRFGHPFTSLQDGEFDHGQYDRVIEVLFVSSCAMLVAREVWQRIGDPDDRLTSQYEDLDFCWRARMAGYRVLMTPLARVRHGAAGGRGEHPPVRRHGERYFGERASVASMLKNYSLLTLLWILPLYSVFGLARLLVMTLSRRFEDAWELLSAWGWNFRHLFGTIRRRRRAQSVRTVRDKQIRRFMESASLRVPRWMDEASQILQEQQLLDEDTSEGESRVRVHAASLVRSHPVLVGSVLAAIVGYAALDRVLRAHGLSGGVLAPFPSASAFFTELVSAVRTTHLGGAESASPALGGLGALSWVLFRNASLAQRVLLVALPFVAGAMLYRAATRLTGERIGATVAAACYALSAIMFGAFSQGRVELLVALAVLPVLVERLGAAFGREETQTPRRLAAGIGLTLAIGIAFLPGIVLPVMLVVLVFIVAAPVRGRGVPTTLLGIVIGAILVFPLLPQMVLAPGASISSLVGEASFSSIVRTSFAAEPGSWIVSWFLPIAAVCSLAIVTAEHRGKANRLAVLALCGILLSWGSAAGYLPRPVSNPLAFLALVAVAESFLIGFGVTSLVTSVGREQFGLRQLLAGALTVVLVGGLVLQSAAAMTATWSIREDGLPAAWPVVSASGGGDFRVLWVGRRSGASFPAPGGDPQAVVDEGARSLRYALTDRDGVSALDTGRADEGPGYDALGSIVGELAAGRTDHVGAMLAPLGVRYIVSASGDLPAGVVERLRRQLDLDLVPAIGLTIYRNADVLPPASVLDADRQFTEAERSPSLEPVSSLPAATPSSLLDAVTGGWQGRATGGNQVLIGDQFASAWQMDAGGATEGPRQAFGWAMWFPLASRSGAISIRYTSQLLHTVVIVLLGLLWLAALWVTRKPVSS